MKPIVIAVAVVLALVLASFVMAGLLVFGDWVLGKATEWFEGREG